MGDADGLKSEAETGVRSEEEKSNFEFTRWLTAVIVASIAALAIWVPSVLWLIGTIGLIVTIHEGGHFFAAKRSGMAPTEFFWGFGPVLWAYRGPNCTYGIKLLPLGGYVQLQGMTVTSELPDGFEESKTYRAGSIKGRIFTILAGPIVNIFCGVIGFAVVAMMSDGVGPVDALQRSISIVGELIVITGQSFVDLFTGLGDYGRAVVDTSVEAPVRFASPIAQAQYSETFAEQGLVGLLTWFSFLSVVIGMINLAPFPPLDGAHFCVAAIDGIGRKIGSASYAFNMSRLNPVAYVTIGFFVCITLTAAVFDLQDLMALR